MKRWSPEALVGLAVIAVALVAVLWLAGRRPEPAPPPPVALETPGGDSERVRQRLDQLHEERGDSEPEPMRNIESRPLPTRPAAMVPDPGAAAAGPQGAGGAPPPPADFDDDDLNFDQLREMALHDTDPENRIVAVWLLASLEEEPVIPVLTQALSDKDPEVRLAAIESLSDFTDDAPIDAIALALEDPDPEIRFEAVSIAADIDDARVRPLLEKALQDSDEDVRALAEGVVKLDDEPEP